MELFSIAFVAALVGMPVCLAVAWWFWLRVDRRARKGLRSIAAFIGLLAASTNALVYFGWIPIVLLIHNTPWTSKVRDEQGNIAVYLILVAFALAVCGKGKLRIPLATCAILAFFLWIPPAIL